MKNIFKIFWHWLKSLFSSKVEPVPVTKYKQRGMEDHTFLSHTGERGRDQTGAFKNNRKPTRGRYVQFIPLRDGTTKLIRHEPTK